MTGVAGIERRASLALLVAFCLFATACSGDDDSSSGSGGTSAPTTAGTGATGEPSATTSEPPVRGGILRAGIERPASLDPAEATPSVQSQLLAVDLLFDGLTTMAAGSTIPSRALAESWVPSPDLRVWTFTLRGGVSFANGRPVVAADVKYSLERVARLGAGSLAGARLDVVSGWQALVDGSAAELVGVRVVDDRTVEITCDAPFAVLPELLSSPLYGVVPREAVEAPSPAFAAAPVGSGPFSYAGSAGNVVRLERASAAASTPAASSPYLDAVELHFYDSAEDAYADFEEGSLDFAIVPPSRVDDAATEYGTDGIVPFQAELYLALNVTNPKFADVRFRQAIVKAVDRDAIARTAYAGVGVALGSVVPAGVPGHVADPCGSPCAHSAEDARALAVSVFGDPASGGQPVPEVQIDYYTGTAEEALAGVVKANLEAAGIPAAKRPHEFEEYQTFVTSGQQELFLLGWVGVYPAADAYLGPLFVTGARDNVTGFSDMAVDGLLAAARATADASARAASHVQAEAAILAAAPVVPLVQFLTRTVVSPRVRDLAIAVDGTFEGSAVWLSG